jgi:hypothetical protein
LQEMKELTRAKNIHLPISRWKTETEWHESQLDEKKVYIAICARSKKYAV